MQRSATTGLRVLLTGVGILLFSVPGWAAAPMHQWSRRFGDTGLDRGLRVVVDASGNVIMSGAFEGTVDFGGGNLTSAGARDIVVAKYDASGVHQWSKRFGDTGDDRGQSVAVDAAGNVFVTGRMSGTVDFGGGNLSSAGGLDVFLVKFDASGVHQWSKRFGSTDNDYTVGATVDGSGNVIVGGEFMGTVDFGGGNLVSAGLQDVVVAKYDASGAHQWSKRFGDTARDRLEAVAVDASDNVLVTGFFQGTVDFGGGNLVSAGGWDTFLAKYDAAGAHQWSQRFGGTGTDSGRGVGADASGNVFVTGWFNGTVDFGGGNLSSAGISDIFVAKYDAAGAHQWSQRFGNTGDDVGLATAVGPSGSVVVSGYFENTVDFGGGGLTSAGGLDLFIARYSATGIHQWSLRFGDTTAEEARSVAVDGSNNVLATGYTEGTVDFGGGNLTSAGQQDIFLVKFVEDETVPVFIGRFDATPRPEAVDVTWDLSSDETLDRFTLYRRSGASLPVVVASGDASTTRSFTDTSVEPGETYHYELVIKTADGDEFRSSVATVTLGTLAASLFQNYPNPFSPQTTIGFSTSERAYVELNIYDVQGRLIRTLVSETRLPDRYAVTWDGRDAAAKPVAAGVYFYRLSVGDYRSTKKMLLVR